MIEMTRKRLLLVGLVLHVYVFVAWFVAVLSDVPSAGDERTRMPLLFGLAAIAIVAIVLYAVWVHAIAGDWRLQAYLISPMAVTLMTAIRLSIRQQITAVNWIGGAIAIGIALFGVVTFARTVNLPDAPSGRTSK